MPDYLVCFTIPALESAGHICLNATRAIEPDDLPFLCAALAQQIESERQEGEPVVAETDIAITSLQPLYPNTGTPQSFRIYRTQEQRL